LTGDCHLLKSIHGHIPLQELSFPMKFCIRIALSMCVAALLATPASACCLFPFGGWWGAGYYGSPAYTAPAYSSNYSAPAYTSFYGAFSAPSYGCCGNSAPAYSASYGSFGSYDSGCCTNSCGDSCGSGCASGSCVGTTPAGTLKPAQDPISDKKAPSYEDDTRPRRFEPESRSPRNPAADDLIEPVNEKDRFDRFERPGTRESEPANPGTGTDGTRNPGMFDEDKSDPRTRDVQIANRQRCRTYWTTKNLNQPTRQNRNWAALLMKRRFTKTNRIATIRPHVLVTPSSLGAVH
jgi:serine/threonine protein kinase